MSLPAAGKREEKIICVPDNLANCSKDLKSLLIALGLCILALLPLKPQKGFLGGGGGHKVKAKFRSHF